MSPRARLPMTFYLTEYLRQHILTKGDNNEMDDVSLYPPGRNTVLRSEIRGIVHGYVPFLGWAVIAPREMIERASELLARN